MISLVSIVFGKELPLLQLQAKSIELHTKNLDISQIVVIVNDDFSDETYVLLKSVYQSFLTESCELLIISSEELLLDSNIPPTRDWYTQQALKILISKHIKNENYLILDAKNHLIKGLEYSDLFYGDKPITYMETNVALWGNYLNASGEIMQLVDQNVDSFISPATPYLMITKHALGLLEFLEREYDKNIAEVINGNKYVTEFLLYFSYLKKYDLLESSYHIGNPGDRIWATFFAKYPDTEDSIDRVLNVVNGCKVKWIGLHRNRFVKNGEIPPALDIRDRIVDVWLDAKLFNSRKSANDFWNNIALINEK
ncbi:DUF6492 family protein [Thalassotalea mangrovi]|uniref:Uncharacterized protein n=1 Tax=Thalassotalea mangrovi TaxID=2572245 RepID=A0A4U1B840_9GAMM|nr:DUF6492 family protein [Thalassotalea mangrovi]TKB46103.1 hypothetical protein E8M12_05600 [Thalassotalea mangrovi]